MNKIKILIVEDDVLWGLQLEQLVNQLGYVEYLTDNSDEALQLLKDQTPHLALIDISIAGSMDGIELSTHFKAEKIPFIFITSFSDKATFERALASNPFVFLTKPVNLKTLQSAIESALTKSPDQFEEEAPFSTDKKVFIRTNNKLEIIDFLSIMIIEANGNYCDILTKGERKLTIKSSLKKISQKLPPEAFIQVHRSFIVQADFIKNIFLSQNYLSFQDKQIPLGEKYKSALLNRFDTLG